MNRFTNIVLVAAALFAGAACDKTNPDDKDKGGKTDADRVTELNGTIINEEANMIGIVKDASGNPIAGVPVTDGYTYVVTDANGVYQIVGSRYARKAYLSIPSGYEVPLDPTTHLPAFFSPGTIIRDQQNRYDFTLTRQTASEDKFTLVMIGDPQCQTDAQVQRYATETVPNIQSTLSSFASEYPNPYAITLGDIIFDSTNTWEGMKKSMSNVNVGGRYLPFFQCIGNHDHNGKASTDFDATANFFENFGPTDYSFNRGNFHIIVMDDVMGTTTATNSSPNKCTWNYNGGFTTYQWKWLQADLELVPDKDKKCVILCCHIPFRGGSASGGSSVNKNDAYYSEILTALKGFKEAHLMIGHTHYPQNYIHNSYRTKSGLPIYEHVHGAACGAWWSSNLNTNGQPNGYSLYECDAVNGTITNWVAKSTKDDFSSQMRVYDGDQIYTGSKGYRYSWTATSGGGAGSLNVGGTANIFAKGNSVFKNAFVAAIWNDDAANWKVELFQNGVKVGDFKRLGDGGSCDVCVCSFFFNELNKNTSTWTTSTASHYWYFVPASGNPSSEKNWEVVATQTIPSSKKTNVYRCSAFSVDYGGFASN